MGETRGKGRGMRRAARERLVAELERLRSDVAAAEETGLSILLDQCTTGRAPPLGKIDDQRLLAGLRDRDRDRIREVVAALRRLDQGSWGKCVECGGPIEEERLEVLPEAVTCAGCVSGRGEKGRITGKSG